MILFIDTTDFDQTRLALVTDQVVWHVFTTRDLSEKLLPEINKFLRKQKVSLSKVRKLAVVAGPGGFSRTRTGVAVANALAYGLGIPLVVLPALKIPTDLLQLSRFKTQKMAAPIYDRDPHITLSKKK
ncbi:MAG: hypothetical protein KW802_03590 [Candidatus Doudnabacteria bacterium]|nr:hypothetical protein [Candidatus Doudnabacteria bacterium]